MNQCQMIKWQNRVQQNVRHEAGKYNAGFLNPFICSRAHYCLHTFWIVRKYRRSLSRKRKKTIMKNATLSHRAKQVLCIDNINNIFHCNLWMKIRTANCLRAFIPTHIYTSARIRIHFRYPNPLEFNLSLNYGTGKWFSSVRKNKTRQIGRERERRQKEKKSRKKNKNCARWAFSHIHIVKV